MVYVKDPDIADEILQIVFVKIWEKRETLAEVRNLEDFLFISARNTILNHWKRSLRESKALDRLGDRLSGIDETSARVTEEREYRRVFQEALEKLPVQQQRTYILATEEGYSYEEIANELNISRFTVKKHLELARKFVRSYMSQYFPCHVVLAFVFFNGVFNTSLEKKLSLIRPFYSAGCLYSDNESRANEPGTI